MAVKGLRALYSENYAESKTIETPEVLQQNLFVLFHPGAARCSTIGTAALIYISRKRSILVKCVVQFRTIKNFNISITET